MKRAAIYLFFDERGIVDDYILFKLAELRKHVGYIFVISNSPLDAQATARLESVADTVRERENVGYDVWGYKDALEQIGWDAVVGFDELILMNYTFFGPIYPFAEMFQTMEARAVDFWGISAHKEVAPNPYTGTGSLPLHIQSHFIAVRQPMLSSSEFRRYWDEMPMIRSYNDSIMCHEARFTLHFADAGFSFSVYLDPKDFGSDYALFTSLEQTIERRSPILKKRPFIHDPIYLEQHVISLRNAMENIERATAYDTSMIWRSVLRSAEPRTLYTNMDLLEVLPDQPLRPISAPLPRVAVVAHMYYADMIEEMMSYVDNIPVPFDFYITTDTEAKAVQMRRHLDGRYPNAEIRVQQLNQGRDMAPLVIGARDIIRPGRYDLVCRLHSKKSPQDPQNVADNFKRHMFDNLLHSKGYVANILGLFQDNPTLGMVMPPVIHSGYGTLGHAWSINRALAHQWAERLGMYVRFDPDTPLAPYGGMFWFRPDALHIVTSYPWSLADFEVEAGKIDGTVPHVLERLMAYACHEAGYHVRCAMHTRAAAVGYTKLEYKLQRLAALMPGARPRDQLDWLHMVTAHVSAGDGTPPGQNAESYHLAACERHAKAWFVGRFPRLARCLQRPYGIIRRGLSGLLVRPHH